jgi:hypothetical protein
VRHLLAQAVDVWCAGGKLLDQRQGPGVVGLNAPGDALDDDLPLAPELAERCVDRPRRGAARV